MGQMQFWQNTKNLKINMRTTMKSFQKKLQNGLTRCQKMRLKETTNTINFLTIKACILLLIFPVPMMVEIQDHGMI